MDRKNKTEIVEVDNLIIKNKFYRYNGVFITLLLFHKNPLRFLSGSSILEE